MLAEISTPPRRKADGAGFRQRPLLRLAVGALVLMGVVLIGQGAWIKGKAVLSQLLLNQAFAQVEQFTGMPAPKEAMRAALG